MSPETVLALLPRHFSTNEYANQSGLYQKPLKIIIRYDTVRVGVHSLLVFSLPNGNGTVHGGEVGKKRH